MTPAQFLTHFGDADEVREAGDLLGLRFGPANAVLAFEGGDLTVKRLVVDPAARKTGAGKRLMTRVLAAASHAGMGVRLVAVPTEETGAKTDPAAVAALNRFYDRLGFAPGALRVRPADGLPTSHMVAAMAPEIVAAGQVEVDAWEQDENGLDEVLGSGGVCGFVADRMSEVLAALGADVAHAETDFDGGHAFLHARLADGVFRVDVPPGVYETGGGYVWAKRPDAVIRPEDLIIDKVAGPMSQAEFAREYADAGDRPVWS